MRRLLAALLLVSSARAADPDGDGVFFHGSVQLRLLAEQNTPGAVVRYDRATDELTTPSYLATEGHESFGSALASLGLEGRHLDGDLRWVLTVDTGELRSERFHRATSVCWSDRTPSGLALPGSGLCDLFRVGRLRLARVILPVEDTRLEDQAQITSNGRPFREEVGHTLLVREAYASYRFGRAGFAELTAGQKRVVVADGYVHDDYGLAVGLSADLGAIGPPFELAAELFQPTRDLPGTLDHYSPMLVVRADYLPSLFERAGLFAAGLRERSDSLADVFRATFEERLAQVATDNPEGTALHRRANQLLALSSASSYASEGTLGWLGTSGRLLPGKGQRLSWTAALHGGRIDRVTLGHRTLAEGLSLRGQMASIRYELDLRGVGVSGWFLFLSGDELPRLRLGAGDQVVPLTGTYRGFLAVSPYLTETNLFFGGGLSESYADRQARSPGVNGRGVIAPGLSVRWDATEDLSLALKGAWLRAVQSGPFGGLVYGTELDLNASWEATRWLVLGLETDVLFPGDFFRGREPIARGILALDLVTP